MGTYAYCLGEMDIPEEHRAEYARQVLEILRAGGMMTVEELPLYRKKIYLISPPEFDEEGRAKGCYNYFERTSWESWGLSAKRGTFPKGGYSFRKSIPLLKSPEKRKGCTLDLPLSDFYSSYCTCWAKRCLPIFTAAFDLACSSLRFAAPHIVNEAVSLIV